MGCKGIVYSVLSICLIMIGRTKSRIGFLCTGGAAAGAVISPFMGFPADRYGRKTRFPGEKKVSAVPVLW